MIAVVIKETKVGRGLKFLPTAIGDLRKNLKMWLEELAETGKSTIRRNVGSVLDELLQRKGITQDRYNTIKVENDIL